MKKILLTLFCCLMAFASVQAQEVVLDFTTNDWGIPTNKLTAKQTFTNSKGYSITLEAYPNTTNDCYYYANGKYLIFGRKDATLTLPVFDFAVSKIEVIGRGGASGSVKEGLYAGDTKLIQWTGAQGTNTVEIPKANQAAGTVYSIKIESNHNAQITKINIYKAKESSEVTAPSAPKLTESCSFDNSMTVEITNIEEGATVYYTIDNSDPAENGTEYSTPFDITETTTVKAIAVNEAGSSDVVSATYTKSNTIYFEGSVEEVRELYKNNPNDKIIATVTGYIVGAADGTINKPEFNNNHEISSNIIIADKMEEDNKENCITVQLSTTTIKNTLNIVDNKEVYKKKIQITGLLSTYLYSTGIKDLDNAGIYWDVTDVDYATLYLGYKAEIPTTVEAYIVKETKEGYAPLTLVEGILPKETGIILKGKGEHLFNITNAAATANVNGNLLKGTLTDKDIQGEAYVLGLVDGEVGLYKALMNGTAWKNNANKAYLPASALGSASNIQFYGFRFDDEEGTTAIEKVEIKNEKEEIYDLSGRRVNEITEKGIYIVNGKKVLVK